MSDISSASVGYAPVADLLHGSEGQPRRLPVLSYDLVVETSVSKLSHINDAGEAIMVDVSGKADSARVAVAEAVLAMQPATLAQIHDGTLPKGDVLAVARVAGIQGAKRCSELIPLCHPLPLQKVTVSFDALPAARLRIRVECKVTGKTGVEMEALTGASIAALTVYDMCKAVDRGMRIEQVALVHKSGGQSGQWDRGAQP
jgi:cyclic pyranopterin monophosphate synthase